jgi:hypothetical protein
MQRITTSAIACALWVSLALLGCHDGRRLCRQDCQRMHDQCLLPASTPEAIYACDARASSCAAYCQ